MTIVVEISEAVTNNYASLKTQAAGWLARDDLGDEIVQFISLAQSDIAKDLRIRDMEATTEFTVTGAPVALPTDFLGIRRIYADVANTKEILYLTPNRFYQSGLSSDAGSPTIYTIEGNNLIFAPSPTIAAPVTVKMLYIKPFVNFVSDNDSNSLLSDNFDVYLAGTLKFGFKYIRDNEEAGVWKTKFDDSIAKLNRNANRERTSGSKLIRTGTFTP
jgi:hypothetical protein